MAIYKEKTNMKSFIIKFLKDSGLVLLVLIISFFLAVPVIMYYQKYFDVGLTGGPALFLSGMQMSFHVLFGLLLGSLHKYWRTSFVLITTLILLAISSYDFIFHSTDGYWLAILFVVGYIVGFAIRKLVDHFRKPKDELIMR